MIKLAYHRGPIVNHQDFDVFSRVHEQSDKEINVICANTNESPINFNWDLSQIEYRKLQHQNWEELGDEFDILDTSEFYRDYSISILEKFPNKKTVTVFDNMPFGISRGLAGQYSTFCDLVIARSPMIFRMLSLEGVPENKIKIVPSAVDTDLFKPGFLTGNYPVVLFVGRIVPEKGLWDLIVAMSGMDVELQIAGEGDTSIYDDLARLTNTRVNFLGPVSHNQLPLIMRRASILVVPSIPKIDLYNPEASWVEQFGVVILEGMATGIPVIVSDTGSTRDIIIDGEDGYLFPPRSWDILRTQIQNLLKNHALRNQMGARGRERAERMFSTRVIGKTLANIYGNL